MATNPRAAFNPNWSQETMNFLKRFLDWLKRILDWLLGSKPPASTDPIRHVIVLMFESHSFDQMLGCFKSIFPELEGVDPANLRSNKDSTGQVFFHRSFPDPIIQPDPKHEVEHILNSLKDGNSGFVSEYEKEYPDTTPDQRQRIMDYFGLDDLPALHALARNFTICDHWFSSVPGPTWTNRFFVHSGTSKGIVDMPESIEDTGLYLGYDQDTIFDRLNEKGISWRVYFGDAPQSLVLKHQRLPINALHYRPMPTFFDDVRGPEEFFPSYSFIEPNFYLGEQNDDHPPHATMRAQRLLANVYNALRSNTALWNSSLLVVLYDENGGFYDHVSPPAAVPPDQFHDQYTFDRLGVRVPALLISPWVERGVISTSFDHTSLLKYVTEKSSLGPLTERVRQAESFAGAIRISGTPRTDTPPSVPVPPLTAPPGPLGVTAEELAAPVNENQHALMAFSKHLETQTLAPSGPVVMDVAPIAPGKLLEFHRAKKRVLDFLDQQKAKAVASKS
jgi:phospholipase C